VTDFKKLKVWQKAHTMAMDVHRVAGQIRGAKHASLRSQMIRAAMSIPTNIVEGCSQQSAREYSRFVRIALNSTSELEYHLLAARDLAATRGTESLTLMSQVVEVRKMLYGLLHYLASRPDDATRVQAKKRAGRDCFQ
jgi:four helix bundle protein